MVGADLEKKYITLDMVRVSQLQSGIVFTGKIKFGQLNQIYKLTERKESIEDSFGNSKITFDASSQEFQRQLSQKKLGEIESYLREEMAERETGKSLAMFPSSLILYNRAYEPDDIENGGNYEPDDIENSDNEKLSTDVLLRSYKPGLDCCFYTPSDSGERDDLYKLFIPRNREITLIVDGQHRFVGTQRFYNSLSASNKEVVENFEFIVTYLVGFDLYEVGQIFATVNFNQKPVNRSLYYDIFGSAPQTDRDGKLQNDIRLAHDLALHLHNSKTSPVQSMIKLLGKGYGLFSQAFFVDKMIRCVFKTGIWDELLIDYLKGGSEYKIIAEFMKQYFAAMHEAYPGAWPEKVSRGGKLVYSSYYYEYILCKTTGLGAYFRLIKHIYPLVAHDPSNFKGNILNIFRRLKEVEAMELFSKNGDYGGAGSEGLQDKLFKHLLSKYRL
jgi:DGQHR domain-containing protein